MNYLSMVAGRAIKLRVKATLSKFEKEIETAILKAATFFKEERDPFYKRGQAKGIEEGTETKSYEVVVNLIQQLGLDDDAAASVAEVSVDFVKKVRAELNKKKK